VWDGGCTACGNTPIEAAAGSVAGYTVAELGLLLVLLGTMVVGVAMVRGEMFSRLSGYLGIVAGLEEIIGTFAFASLSGPAGEATGLLPYALLALWAFSTSPRLFKPQ